MENLKEEQDLLSASQSESQIESPLKLSFLRFKKNKRAVIGFFITLFFIAVATLAPWLSPYNPFEYNLQDALQSPNAKHFLGTDQFGRDTLTRIIYGSRYSLAIGFIGVGLAIFIGVILGTIAGYFEGIIDVVIMRIIDIFMAFPGFLLALAIVSILGPSIFNLMLAISIFSIPVFARIMRGEVLSVKNNEFIESSKSMGAKHFFIIINHVIPNCMSSVIVLASMRIATAILAASGLGFLGLGAQPPSPEWGSLLSEGRDYIGTANHLTTFPGLCIMLVVVGLNMFGDGLRDAFDPKTKV
ncbi:MAG TPA: nickel transporter permease [Pseudogracilibacillus sp.]|nr:nickel transporter permease [Pseudogracilibacillus sp.]